MNENDYKNGEFFLDERTATVFVKIPGGKLLCSSFTASKDGLERAKEYLALANSEKR